MSWHSIRNHRMIVIFPLFPIRSHGRIRECILPRSYSNGNIFLIKGENGNERVREVYDCILVETESAWCWGAEGTEIGKCVDTHHCLDPVHREASIRDGRRDRRVWTSLCGRGCFPDRAISYIPCGLFFWNSHYGSLWVVRDTPQQPNVKISIAEQSHRELDLSLDTTDPQPRQENMRKKLTKLCPYGERNHFVHVHIGVVWFLWPWMRRKLE